MGDRLLWLERFWVHSRAIWAPPHARHSCLYLQLGNLHLPSFHRRQMEACWDWVRWAVKPDPGQAETSGSQASIGWWGFHGQDDAEWSSCRQTLHRAMALSRPVKASLYRQKSCTDQLWSFLARASHLYWWSYTTHRLPSQFRSARIIEAW